MTNSWASSLQAGADALAALPPVLDAHVHVGRWRRPPYEGIATTWESTAVTLRTAGIGGAVVLPVGPTGNASLLAELQASPSDVEAWFFPWIAPGDADALAFAQEHAPSVAGLKLHPSFDGCRIVDDGYEPVLRAAGEQGWPVLLHCGRWQEMAGWELALQAAERHPDVPFILAHFGGDEPHLRRESVRAARSRGLDNVCFETSGAREFWLVRELVDELGADWLMYGSDFNLHHPTTMLAVILAAGLPASTLAAVLGGNLRRLMAGRPRFQGGICV